MFTKEELTLCLQYLNWAFPPDINSLERVVFEDIKSKMRFNIKRLDLIDQLGNHDDQCDKCHLEYSCSDRVPIEKALHKWEKEYDY